MIEGLILDFLYLYLCLTGAKEQGKDISRQEG